MSELTNLNLTINGTAHQLKVSKNRTLMSILRDDLHLTGTKCGCNEGTCGSCTVIMNGKAVRSCTIKPNRMEKAKIETIEALSDGDILHPIQTAFIERQGGQCGFCTPGMIMAAKALLETNANPTEKEIAHALRVNLCRCTGYQQIIEAVLQAAGQLESNADTGKLELVGSQTEYNWVGRSIPRIDAIPLVTGTAQYTDDIPDPENILFLVAKRAEYAHARILNIDPTEALKIDGVERVITAKDIPGENKHGKIIRDIPVLADGIVRSFSDAVALVVAKDYATAEAGVEAVKVTYEELPSLFDPEKSLDSDAPVLHPKGNLLYEFNIIKGDTDKGFAECDAIIEETFHTQRVDHGQLEPEAALAYFDESGKLCIKAPTQHVYFDRLNIIRALGLPKDDVRVIQPPVGGAFGKREDMYGQIHCALAAFLIRRPVRTVYSREETLRTTQKRHPVRIKIKVGATAAGRIKAFQGEALSDTGAYASWGQNILRKICVHMSGPYEIENVRINGKAVYTNNIFCGAMRGFGTPQAVFASESALDMLAEKLGIDKVEIRKINSFRPGSKTATGQKVINTPGKKTIELTADKVDWNSKAKRSDNDSDIKRGIGIGSIWYGIGFGAGIPDHGDAIVELSPEGCAKVFVSTVDYGQGSNTIFPQIAAETLGLNPDDIEMITGDSDLTPNCGSTVATRQTFITGNAIKKACDILAIDIKEVASQILGINPDEVIMKNRRYYNIENESHSVGAPELFSRLVEFGKPMRREAIFKGEKFTEHLNPVTGQGNAYHPIAYGTQIAEVSVDTKSGKVEVDKITACHYIGKALNPESVRGQVVGGISMGWGYALTEDASCTNGEITNDNFGRYKMMRTTDMPDYDVILLEDDEPTGPYGAIGIGEPPTVATAPAIVNAVNDAIGVRITSLPITPEKILSALKNKGLKK